MKKILKQKLTASLAVAATLGMLTACPAFAQFNQGNTVTFNNSPMFSITGDAGGFSSERRAWHAQDAFDNALVNANDRSPSAVNVAKVNGAYTIRLGGEYITTADAASARKAGMSPEALAHEWADAIRARLSDQEATENYVALLREDHDLEAGVAIVERDVMVTDTLPFRLAEGTIAVSTNNPKEAVAVLKKPVVLSNCRLPEGSVLTGAIHTSPYNKTYVEFTRAQLPSGDTLELNNVVAMTIYETESPKPVITASIPADPQAEARLPATIGIGAKEGSIAVLQARPASVAMARESLGL